MSGLVLYAIVGERPDAALGTGMLGGPLVLVRVGGAHVVVEHGAAAEATPRMIRAHDRVVRRIARATSAVLPFRFGSVASSAAALRKLLAPVAGSIAESLELVEGCVQYTIRVYGEPEKAGKAEPGMGPGTQWLAVKLRARRVPEIAPVTGATTSFVRATRAERHDHPPLVASVYHLVPKTKTRAYRTALARASTELTHVELRMTGPWPPYAFAELP